MTDDVSLLPNVVEAEDTTYAEVWTQFRKFWMFRSSSSLEGDSTICSRLVILWFISMPKRRIIVDSSSSPGRMPVVDSLKET